jgi:hypothetical protein
MDKYSWENPIPHMVFLILHEGSKDWGKLEPFKEGWRKWISNAQVEFWQLLNYSTAQYMTNGEVLYECRNIIEREAERFAKKFSTKIDEVLNRDYYLYGDRNDE